MSLSCLLQPSCGFHFVFSTNLTSIPTKPGCDLYLQHVLPADVFVDKYELKEHGHIFNLHGESNLEHPLIAADPAGSTLEVRVPLSMSVNIPLHARYALPSTSLHSIVRIPEPQAFWACHVPNKSGQNPSHLAPSLYVDLNVSSIMFCDTCNKKRYHEIQVPVGHHPDAIFVEFGTIFVVVAAFFYVLRVIWATTIRMHKLNSKLE